MPSTKDSSAEAEAQAAALITDESPSIEYDPDAKVVKLTNEATGSVVHVQEGAHADAMKFLGYK